MGFKIREGLMKRNEGKSETNSPKREKETKQPSMDQSNWMVDFGKKLDQVKAYRGGYSIFRLPGSLKKLHPEAFIPHVISIGPVHRGKPHLLEMEYHKRRVLKHVVKRSGKTPEILLSAMFQIKKQTQRLYEQWSNDDDKTDPAYQQQFVEMMLLDACFILEALNVAENGIEKCGYATDDPIFASRSTLPYIQRDFLMLENQIPLHVLERLLPLTWHPESIRDSVPELVLNFFDSVIPGLSQNRDSIRTADHKDSLLHILNIVRQSLQPITHFRDNNEPVMQYHTGLPSVTRLRGTGVAFVKKKDTTKFTEIEFKEGKLHISPVVIDAYSKTLFLNLMAFEECYPYCDNYITSYLTFMDGLIDSPKDVQHLQENGIIESEFGNGEDVANIFNNLRREIVIVTDNYYLAGVTKQLNSHFQSKRWTWIASLKEGYLKDPWKITSLVAATFLILLTFIQTLYTLLGYYHPLS